MKFIQRLWDSKQSYLKKCRIVALSSNLSVPGYTPAEATTIKKDEQLIFPQTEKKGQALRQMRRRAPE